jgi:hypothetical protein
LIPEEVNKVGDLATLDCYERQIPFMSGDVNQGFSALQFDASSHPLQKDLPRLGEVQAQFLEDPFMGWTNKTASQICDDYGWVLSHVGTL